MHEEMKIRLNSSNFGYPSVQNLLSSRLLSKNVNINIYRTLISACSFVWMRYFVSYVKEIYKLRAFWNNVIYNIQKGQQLLPHEISPLFLML
jgi:hypothetical protein